MRQRGFVLGIWGYVAAAIAILALIAGLIAWADQNIATSAGVKKGKAETQAAWDAANEAARAREAAASAKAAADLAAARKKRKVVVQTITKEVDREVEKLVYRDVCLPHRGLCLANAAILGTVEAGCLADGAVPAIKPN